METTFDKGTPIWLTAILVKCHGFALHKNAFQGALCLHYGWQPPQLHCSCGQLDFHHWPCTLLKRPYTQAINPYVVHTYKELLHTTHICKQPWSILDDWHPYSQRNRIDLRTWISDELAGMFTWVLHYDHPRSPAWSATNWPHQPTISPCAVPGGQWGPPALIMCILNCFKYFCCFYISYRCNQSISSLS